jgi:hypothetical protein
LNLFVIHGILSIASINASIHFSYSFTSHFDITLAFFSPSLLNGFFFILIGTDETFFIAEGKIRSVINESIEC